MPEPNRVNRVAAHGVLRTNGLLAIWPHAIGPHMEPAMKVKLRIASFTITSLELRTTGRSRPSTNALQDLLTIVHSRCAGLHRFWNIIQPPYCASRP